MRRKHIDPLGQNDKIYMERQTPGGNHLEGNSLQHSLDDLQSFLSQSNSVLQEVTAGPSYTCEKRLNKWLGHL